METILAIDTATNTASAALLRDGAVLGSAAVDSSGHASNLLSMIDELCATHAVAARDLTAVAIGLGPGSFTGLRIGMATAKGIAFAAALPMWGCSSLAAVAYQMRAAIASQPVARPAGGIAYYVALLDARRGEIFVGAFGPELAPHGDERVIAPSELPAYLQTLVATNPAGPHLQALALGGDALLEYPELADLAAQGATVLAPFTPSASAIGALAQRGARVDIRDDGTPVYIRKAEAEINYPDGVPGAFRASKQSG